ncbi:ABC transporter ATP-binding protein [Alkalihalobacillus sp. BA299]|uniref:ABC transporter ATP-binding protein n=1 Tax=Alkalihalobacillus sp. BA299 TaxID=2815938 RepID=UPI001ADCA167|nr:dipeptide/oligopeptide/nickel ABC transporter ATP-binding protein [Alkalihalobacillus sp. BA299]
MTLLNIQDVTKRYPFRLRRRKGLNQSSTIKALHEINLTLNRGESLGIVGESGSGKSTLAKVIMNIERPSSGKVLMDGKSMSEMKDLTIYKRIQLVLQDSSTSLYPRLKVRDILEEPIHNYFPEKDQAWKEERLVKILKLVNLPLCYLSRLPGQLSGGQKQRVCIAKALAVQPEIIIFDESIASLDQSAQIEIINMLKHIKNIENISYLFITHDLLSIRQLCDQVSVIYQGEIVETFSNWDIQELKHPYSRSLFRAGAV